jgi:1L-myo-inositol 1-phosphate cytidylyltransferase
MRDGKRTALQAVVLAAGDGDRMHPHAGGRPKSLIQICGRPIINHVLDGLFAAGVRDTLIVVGYKSDELRRALADVSPCGMNVRFVENAEFAAGNARSLWAARDEVHGPFVLAMADHLAAPSIARRLAAGAGDRCRLAIEFADQDDARADEATRALVRDGLIIDLGKTIGEWNAFDTGTFWCTPAIFDAITAANRDGELGVIFATLAHAGELEAVDITGSRWIDVDTEADVTAAQSMWGSPAARQSRRRDSRTTAADGVA